MSRNWLLVQNGVVTACTQIEAQPFTGFFPAMRLSTSGGVYVANPPPASLKAHVEDTTVITASNQTLTYDINGYDQSVNIQVGSWTPSELMMYLQDAIINTAPPYMQLQVSLSGPNTIEVQPSPPDVAEVDFSVSGSAVDPSALDFTQTSVDNEYIQNYNPDSLPNCAALTVMAPTPGNNFVSANLPATSRTATGTITFSVFGPLSSPPTDCTTSNPAYYPVGTAPVMGGGTYSSNTGFSPPLPAGAGDYWWYASYAGDPDNNPGNSVCGSGMPETVFP